MKSTEVQTQNNQLTSLGSVVFVTGTCCPASLQWCLLDEFGSSKPRNQAESAKSFHQIGETPAIFLTHRREFQPQSTTGLYMPHNSFGPDLTFFDKKMKVCLRPHRP
jgi:hypothetical protein